MAMRIAIGKTSTDFTAPPRCCTTKVATLDTAARAKRGNFSQTRAVKLDFVGLLIGEST
ncbi:MAG: hypothetical protein ACYTEE_01235 [Planctomycetota bacterium]